MTNLDKVREALESLRRVAPVQSYEDEAEVALTELDAHEQEVAALVEAATNVAKAIEAHGISLVDLSAALRPFTGDEK